MITAADEHPIYFDGPGGHLAGVLTVPPNPNGLTIIIPWGGGAYPSSGKNRIRTRLAREMAADGYHTFRFDYEGVGESGGEYKVADLHRAFRNDITAAMSALADLGHTRIVVVANCIGGWSALTASPNLTGVEAMAIVRAPVSRDHQEVKGAERTTVDWLRATRRFRPRYLRDAKRRGIYRKMLGAKARSLVPGGGARSAGKESAFAIGVRHLLEHDIPLLLLYSNDDHFHHDLAAVLAGGLGDELERAPATTRLVLTEERLQGWQSLSAQTLLVDEVRAWLREVTARQPSATG